MNKKEQENKWCDYCRKLVKDGIITGKGTCRDCALLIRKYQKNRVN